MLHAELVREGFKVNVKVVERIYREERLWLRRTKRKKIPKEGREGGWCPIAANQRWSLDFTSDALANGRKFRTANLKNDCTRECSAIDVDFSLPGERVVELLNRVARERGHPDILVVDKGPELRGRALDAGPMTTVSSSISSTLASRPRTRTSKALTVAFGRSASTSTGSPEAARRARSSKTGGSITTQSALAAA